MERQPRAEIEARTGSALKRCWLGIRAHIRGERDHSRAMALPDRLSMLQATLEKVRDLRRSLVSRDDPASWLSDPPASGSRD
jgi:hypothetical protein